MSDDGPWNDYSESDSGPWNDYSVSIPEDLVKSIPADVKAAASGFGGWPGDVRDMLHGLGRYVGLNRTPEGQDWLSQADATLNQNLGLSPDTKLLRPLTTSDIAQGLDSITGGPSYQPQTGLGKDFLLGSSMAGSMVGGPESVGTKLATRVIAPVVGSEVGGAAGNLVGGDTGEQIGRIAGLLAGGPVAGLGAIANEERNFSRLVPTTQEVHDRAQAEFKTAGLDNVQLNPLGYSDWASQLYQNLRKDGFNPGNQALSGVKSVLADIFNTANRPSIDQSMASLMGYTPGTDQIPLTLGGIVQLRQQASNLFKNTGPNREVIHKYAHDITNALDDYVNKLSGPGDIISGNPQQAQAVIQDARGLWARYKKAQTLDNIVNVAEGKAQANFTQAGFQTAVRQGVNNLLKQIDAKKSLGWTPDEVNALRQARNPGGVGTALRAMSVFSPRGWGGMMASGLLGSGMGVGPLLQSGITHIAGPLLAAKIPPIAALAGMGEIGRAAGNMLARSAVNRARETVLSGTKLNTLPRVVSPEGILGGLYGAGQIGLNQLLQ